MSLFWACFSPDRWIDAWCAHWIASWMQLHQIESSRAGLSLHYDALGAHFVAMINLKLRLCRASSCQSRCRASWAHFNSTMPKTSLRMSELRTEETRWDARFVSRLLSWLLSVSHKWWYFRMSPPLLWCPTLRAASLLVYACISNHVSTMIEKEFQSEMERNREREREWRQKTTDRDSGGKTRRTNLIFGKQWARFESHLLHGNHVCLESFVWWDRNKTRDKAKQHSQPESDHQNSTALLFSHLSSTANNSPTSLLDLILILIPNLFLSSLSQ